MSCPNLTSNDPILLIGAGPAQTDGILHGFYKCDRLICADGGVRHALAAGLRPDLVVGDFDSLIAQIPLDLQRFETPDQNFTDFEKALQCVVAPLVLATGVLGARLDHHMASFSTMLKSATPVIAFDEHSCVVMAPPNILLELELPTASPVSFYPMLEVQATTSGVAWPVTDETLSPDGLISTSNRMDGRNLQVFAKGPGLFCIFPLSSLHDLTDVMMSLVK